MAVYSENERLYLDGDFDTLYTKNKRLISYFVRKFQNTGIETEELYGLVNIAFAKSLKNFNPLKARWVSYFGVAAKNEVLMYLRTENKLAKTVSLNAPITMKDSEDGVLEDVLGDDTVNTEESAISQLEKSNLYTIINTKLNDRQKQVITLKLEGKTQSEIAKILGIAQPSVSRNEKNAYNVLKKYLHLI